MARSKEKVEEASAEKGDLVQVENAEDESRMGRQHQNSKQDDEVCFTSLLQSLIVSGLIPISVYICYFKYRV
jgi:hypothetical protein